MHSMRVLRTRIVSWFSEEKRKRILEWKWRVLWVALAVLMPLAAWPGWVQPRQAVKMSALLLGVASLVFIGALRSQMGLLKPLRAKWYGVWLGVLVVFVAISAWHSAPVWDGWLGMNAGWSEAVLPLVALCALSFFIAQNRSHELLRAGVFAGSVSITLGSALLLAAPFWPSSWLVAWVGSPTTMQTLTAIAWLWAGGVWLFERAVSDTFAPGRTWRWAWRTLLGMLSVEMLLWCVWADAWPFYVVGLAGAVVFIGLALFRPQSLPSRRRFNALLLACVVLGLGWLLPIGKGFVPVEVEMSQAFSWRLAQESWKDYGWAFGAGPDTFRDIYTKHRPPESVNITVGEQVFERSGSEIATLAATWGLLPLMVFAVGVLAVLVLWVRAIRSTRDREEWATTARCGGVVVPLAVASAVMPFEPVLWWVFWSVLGLVSGVIFVKESEAVHGRASARAHLLVGTGTIASGVVLLVAIAYTGGMLVSECLLMRAIRADVAANEGKHVADTLSAATRWRPTSAALARAAATSSVRALSQEGLSVGEAKQYAEFAIAQGKRARVLNTQDARNSAALADVYANLGPAVAGANAQAVEMRRAALVLDPVAPARQVALAKALLVLADEQVMLASSKKEGVAAVQPLLAEAETVLSTLTARWPLYAPAIYTRAALRDRQGRLPDAIQELAALAAGRPNDAGVWFELGVLSLRATKTPKPFVRLSKR